MRITIILLTLILAACASRPSIEELEDQAMVSGDWSAVEAREKAYERQRGESALVCPVRYTKVCHQSGADDKCSCVPPGY
ncbi:MAG: hypothetical protein ACR2QL_07535 [Woeseiaceae bacterium]